MPLPDLRSGTVKAKIFAANGGARLIFTADAWRTMHRYRQARAAAPEAGGALLGRHLLDSEDIVVDSVTTPQPGDRRSRTRFFRSHRHASLAVRGWQASDYTQDYLGLWHTHPERVPAPSWIDVLDWRRAVKEGGYIGPNLFFVIVGIVETRIWRGDRMGTIKHLKRNG